MQFGQPVTILDRLYATIVIMLRIGELEKLMEV